MCRLDYTDEGGGGASAATEVGGQGGQEQEDDNRERWGQTIRHPLNATSPRAQPG